MDNKDEKNLQSGSLTSLGSIKPRKILEIIAKRKNTTDTTMPTSDRNNSGNNAIVILLVHGSWNTIDASSSLRYLIDLISTSNDDLIFDNDVLIGTILVDDDDDDSVDVSINALGVPSILPALGYAKIGTSSYGDEIFRYMKMKDTYTSPTTLHQQRGIKETLINSDNKTYFKRLLKQLAIVTTASHGSNSIPPPLPPTPHPYPPIRLFIAGDRSHVGKSSICLGLLGTLIHKYGYDPARIAYIKPATQCEAPSLVSRYCQKYGIGHTPIGPVVYFKGFTREFLEGRTLSSEVMLGQAAAAVDGMMMGCCQVILIDGVGYPSVGSITGTCNASVARACRAPVVIVGKSGVGDAVDSYNLNASYFKSRGVTVLGAIFNRLAMEGYYSLDNCQRAVEMYFERFVKTEEEVFGFIPEMSELSGARENEGGEENAWEAVENFVTEFAKRVDVKRILERAATASMMDDDRGVGGDDLKTTTTTTSQNPSFKNKAIESESHPNAILTREQIEQAAMAAGAAGG